MATQDDIGALMRVDTPTGIPERIVPGRTDRLETADHMARYGLAAKRAQGATLDLGSGVGYGTAVVAAVDGRKGPLVAVDISQGALTYGKRTYDKSIRFVAADAGRLPIRDESFDTVVCIEAIEHVSSAGGVLREIARVLRPDGLLIISTPNKWMTSPLRAHPENPYHVREWYPRSFIALVSRHFRVMEVLGQSFHPPGRTIEVFWHNSKPGVKATLDRLGLLRVIQFGLSLSRRVLRAPSESHGSVDAESTSSLPSEDEIRAAWPRQWLGSRKQGLPITVVLIAHRTS
jgi:ubiquinone/menaquinone biosynthesis C-methylase UbiE